MNALDYLASVGCTIIITWSALFERVRAFWPKFFGCAMCVGFWVGLGASLFLTRQTPDFTSALKNAFAVSLLSFATYLTLNRIQR
jgi:hypothetical protein